MLLPKIHVLAGMQPGDFGRNAMNTLTTVQIVEHPFGSWIGILAQEVYECHHRWKTLNLSHLIPAWRRKLELMGHAIESYAAFYFDGENLETYELEEAQALKEGYDGLFADVSIGNIICKLRANRNAAKKWVLEHEDFLMMWQSRYLNKEF